MKLLSILFAAAILTGCAGSKKNASQTYKARFEIDGLCSNYTFKLLEGSLDKSLIEANWTDETTGKAYTDVFGIANPCNFPQNVKKGDTFYFVVDTNPQKDCAVCMAYYPTPQKKLAIKVVAAP